MIFLKYYYFLNVVYGDSCSKDHRIPKALFYETVDANIKYFPLLFKNSTVVVDLERRNVIDAGHARQQFTSVRLVPDEEHHNNIVSHTTSLIYYCFLNIEPGRGRNVGPSRERHSSKVYGRHLRRRNVCTVCAPRRTCTDYLLVSTYGRTCARTRRRRRR